MVNNIILDHPHVKSVNTSENIISINIGNDCYVISEEAEHLSTTLVALLAINF